MFYLFYTAQMVITGACLIGIPYFGSAGLIVTLQMFSAKAETEAYMCLIATLGYAVELGAMIYMYYKVLNFQTTRSMYIR